LIDGTRARASVGLRRRSARQNSVDYNK